MSAYYPPGSMAGSGVDDVTFEAPAGSLFCGGCEDNGLPQGLVPVDVEVTRRGRRMFFDCPCCGTSQETACE